MTSISSAPKLELDELSSVFAESETEPSRFLIGAESEKFGVDEKTGRALGYGEEFSVCKVLNHLSEKHGWESIKETPESPVIGLKRRGASITLEPSAQLELSGAALPDLHEVSQEALTHLEEIREISAELGIAWLGCGFHPLASREVLPWVPKQRYPIMREYLPTVGSGGLDMMQRTATVQGNFDRSSEADGMRKLAVALRLSPLMQAWFSNAPFKEGKLSGSLSLRGDVWRHMDPSRSGLIPPLWEGTELGYRHYAEWALSAGMFLFRRDGEIIRNTGQTFRDFIDSGFEGHVACLDDWRLHLTTLFPEVRLKNTLEVRSVDGLPPSLALASLAVWTGILYDEQALDEAWELSAAWQLSDVEASRPQLVMRALHADFCGRLGFEWAERLLAIAEGGLRRRGRRSAELSDETSFLAPAAEIVQSRVVPAERVIAAYKKTGSLICANRISF